VIVLGGNDITNFFRGINRYEIGQELQTQGVLENTYEDPVPYNELFKVVNGVLQPNVELLINVSCTDLRVLGGEPRCFRCPESHRVGGLL